MGFSRLKFAGLLTIILLLSASHAAKRHRRKPWINSEQVVSNRERTSNQAHDSQIPTTNHRWEPTSPPTMNVGDLSNAILNAVRPPSRSSHGRPTNRNNRGNQNFRTMPAEPREVNYTMSEIVARFPWITNPSGLVSAIVSSSSMSSSPSFRVLADVLAVSGVTNISRSSDRGHPTSVPTGNRPSDGWTRFNNPQYLRDRFAGLNYDNYGFRPKQGVKTANGKYKVKLSQDWRSLPVYGFDIVMEQENDANLILESADGEFLSGIEEDITSEVPAITKEDAIQKAIDHNMDHGKEIENPSAELIVDTVGDTAILAYLINYFVPGEELVPLDPVTQPPPTTTTTTTTTAAPTTTTTFAPVTRFRWRNCNRGRNGRRWGNGGRGRNKWSRRRRCARRPWSRPASRTTVAASPTPPRTVPVTEPTIGDTTTTIPDFKNLGAGNKRPWLLMNANSGVIYKTWEGLSNLAPRPARVNILTGNPVYGLKSYREYMYKDYDQGICYYRRPIGGGKWLRVNDRITLNRQQVYKFKCSEGNQNTYDQTNGAASTRNSAYKWGYEATKYLRQTSNTVWQFDLYIETHHNGILAQWNGQAVQLGDGDPRFFFPLSTPDTVIHEVTHAFTEHQSRLEYRAQSGAINEAYSDMAAAAFLDQFFRYSDPDVYMIGRTSLRFKTALRDLCNPGNNRLLQYRPDKPIITSALDYTIDTDLHNASALYSKAFCQLSKTPGWDIQEAFKVFTMANVIYWKPRDTFNSAACGVKKAALDRRQTQQATIDVDKAFAVVDIACDIDDWVNLAHFSSSRSSEEGMTSSTTSATTSTLPEPLSDAIIEEARDLYKMEETKIVGRRQWVIMNANTGIVYKEWEGLASAMTMSRVSLLVGLHSDPEIYDVLVRKDTETNLCYYQMYLGSQKYLTVIDKNNPGTNFRHTYEFPCGVTDDNDYDITNGVKSPRNSAYKWASEGLRFLRSASNLRIDFHLDVEVHHHGLGAYWNGEKISLGDGDDRYFYPMTKPDIVVHEVAHAFTEHKSRLQYRGQSGSIDEAYADMAACAFMSHFYNDNTDSVYKIGASVSKFGIPLRDMCNPGSPRLVAYDRNHPIITDARDWQVSTGIHNASSLYSKAFCELSKRPGWDIKSAFKVFTMANMVYWHPIETFDSASCGVRKAAMDFRGTNQAVNDVDMAFSSAGIKCRST